ncbi:alpha/beta fold hydrolase [Aurantimonas sp. C2-6-R+9]|uniref:alpha/beta fold hydrolase n=1 Tax=unclassified Aurantimonas TaxID=2638230 RepID=UPI002E17AFC5|nr:MULTISPECIES: alpha/beta fold hydrolase [unclassified Aurantimonas]MEC5292986.1 alpha/beta fold hydrolase [Aurantimonas sp. C2-3-R2]MEC5382626.1 alpha/beta fold hydrolase [Aurantimonas sp. C2-6-R+9]MEC5413995.1 alpha/beta fold hydrolase [Aurantimonas sp. C2-4-R8]
MKRAGAIRTMLAVLAASLAASAARAAGENAAGSTPPIVFVHGEGDSAAFWMPVLWRFESNGYPADRLFAADIDHPSARTDDTVAEENRSSSEEAARSLARTVERALTTSGAEKVAIVAHSRGCQTARNYVKNFGGADKVAGMVLAGCVHHGVYANSEERLNSEYNGAGRFLTALNQPPEVPDNIPVTVIRSDRFDLYAQPDARFLGLPGEATGVSYDAPELKGADTVVLDGIDHRETATSPEAFIAIHKALTGQVPATLDIEPEDSPTVAGEISGYANGAPTNLPLDGARLTVFAVDSETGERQGEAVLEKTVGADGRFGPFPVQPGQRYEFVVAAEGYPVTRIYRSGFPRSTDIANLRLYPAVAGAIAGTTLPGEVVNVMRPRGYFGIDDNATLGAIPIAGRPETEEVPSVWKSSLAVDGEAPETITAGFNGETIAARTTPENPDDIVWVEFSN